MAKGMLNHPVFSTLNFPDCGLASSIIELVERVKKVPWLTSKLA